MMMDLGFHPVVNLKHKLAQDNVLKEKKKLLLSADAASAGT